MAGAPFEERKHLRDEPASVSRPATAQAIRLSEELVARSGRRQHRRGATLGAGVAGRAPASPDDPAQHERAGEEIAELERGPADSSLATALLGRTSARLRFAGIAASNEPALTESQRAAALASWQDLERAEACQVPAAQAQSALLARVALCRVLGRDEEGLRASAAAIEDLRARLPASELSPTLWGDRLVLLQNLYGYRVSLLVAQRPPRVREAFECADLGRAQAVRQQLMWAAGATVPAGDAGPPSYGPLLELLRRESAALVMFDVGARRAGRSSPIPRNRSRCGSRSR